MRIFGIGGLNPDDPRPISKNWISNLQKLATKDKSLKLKLDIIKEAQKDKDPDNIDPKVVNKVKFLLSKFGENFGLPFTAMIRPDLDDSYDNGW